MNPRQRRGVLFMILSVVMAGIVFVTVLQYVGSVRSEVGPTATVYRAKAGVPAFTTLTADMLAADTVPERWLSASAVLDEEDLVGRRVGVGLAEGTMLTADVLVAESSLGSTQREIAINVDAVTGIAGRVEPGDFVDIYAVFEATDVSPAQVRVLVRSVRVISVAGRQTVVSDGGDGLGEQSVIPVTLALDANDALAVTYAGAFAAEVRLVGLPGGVAEDRSGEIDLFSSQNLATGGAATPAPQAGTTQEGAQP